MTNPFEILGLPSRFQLTDEEIESRYLELSREHHPDFNQGSGADEQVAVLQKSAAINDAYRAIRDPWSRVDALIRVHDNAAMESTKTLSPMFLIEAMEVREATQENPTAELAELEQTVIDKIDQYFTEVVAKLESGEVHAAATLLHQSNYYRKALVDLRDRIESST